MSQKKDEFGTLPPNSHGDFRPFETHVSESEIENLKTLLRLSRLGPQTYENSLRDGRLGLSYDWLQHAVSEWSNTFDW